MIEPTENVLVSICELDGNHHWEEVKKWLKDSLGAVFIESAHRQNETANYAYNAGRTAELYELYNMITKAHDTLTKMRTVRGRR